MGLHESIKVFVADPTFNERGLGVPAIPLGAGLVASYLKKHLPQIDIKVLKELDPLLESIKKEKPDVLGLTNYIWNTNLCVVVADFAREVNPDMLIISGGPELDSLERLFANLNKVLDQSQETQDELAALKDYLCTLYFDRCQQKTETSSEIIKEFEYDVKKWYESGNIAPLSNYRRKASYLFMQTEMSKIDQLIVWQSIGFKRNKTGYFTEAGGHLPRLYARKLRRDVETASCTSSIPSEIEKRTQSNFIGE